MNKKELKEVALTNKEHNNLTKVHAEFEKTIYGKKTKSVILNFKFFSISFFLLAIISGIGIAVEKENLAFIIGTSSFAVLFFISSLLFLVSNLIYENMAMNYAISKK